MRHWCRPLLMVRRLVSGRVGVSVPAVPDTGQRVYVAVPGPGIRLSWVLRSVRFIFAAA